MKSLVLTLLLVSSTPALAGIIPISGNDPKKGFCEGTLDAWARSDGKLQTDLKLKYRNGATLRIQGALDPKGGTHWRAEFKVVGLGLFAETGVLKLDCDTDAGYVEGTYSTGPGGTYFRDEWKKPPVTDGRATQPLAPSDPKWATAVQVRYYGAAGYHVKRGDDEIVFAPWLSATKFTDVAASEVLKNMKPDEKRIDDALAVGLPLANARAILVGHGHYDHLMDVPPVARKHAPLARIFCNKTSANILAGEPDGAALVARTEVLDQRLGQWVAVPGANVRVMALPGEHPPHLWGGIQFYTGNVDKPRTSPPRKGTDWKAGQTFVYLVDFLDAAGKPAFRIYYQDAGPKAPKGLVPPAVLAERRIDLAIYCISLQDYVHGFPRDLTKALNPRNFLLGHWEDIFRQMPGYDRTKTVDDIDFHVVHATHPRSCIHELNSVRAKDSSWIMPLPSSLYVYEK